MRGSAQRLCGDVSGQRTFKHLLQSILYTTMDSKHDIIDVDERPKLITSKSPAMHEDLEELSQVVGGSVVSDDRSLPQNVGEPKGTLDKIVVWIKSEVTLDKIGMVIVVVGIILFASTIRFKSASASRLMKSQALRPELIL